MLDHQWKRWVAENKLLNVPDQEIVNILLRHGFDERAARDEIHAVNQHPYFQAANSYTQLLHKRQSFATIRRELAKFNPKSKIIERRWNLSRDAFLEQYYATNRPVVMCDMMKNWSAMTRWTPDYLKQTCGNIMVSVSFGRNDDPSYETNDEKHRRSMRFAEYVDMVTSAGETNDFYMTARSEFLRNPGAAPLLRDIEMFPEFINPGLDGFFMWYGPKGTYTPLHQDIMNIFMAQVKGRKRVRLIPAEEMDLVYNDQDVYSPIDFRNPDYDKYPKFREATIMETELAPGEVLFLPVGCWHDVTALDESITVTFNNFNFPNSYQWVHPKRPQAAAVQQASVRESPYVAQGTLQQPIAGASSALAMAASRALVDVVPEIHSHPRVPERWMMWIKDSLTQKCDMASIIQSLDKGGFSRSEIQAVLGDAYPKGFVLPLGTLEVLPGIDYKAITEVPPARLQWLPGFKHIESPHLQLFTIDDFLTEMECDVLVSLMNSRLRPSTVTQYVEGYRTSMTCELCNLNHPLVATIDQKMSMAMGFQLSYSDGTEGQKYLVGQEFKEHYDYFELETEGFQRFAVQQGQRTWTMLVYLNDVPRGGGTRFVTVDKTIYPKKGKAVVWNNRYPDGRLNRDSKHWGMPVEEGEKYIITKWFREKGQGSMFYDDVYPALEVSPERPAA